MKVKENLRWFADRVSNEITRPLLCRLVANGTGLTCARSRASLGATIQRGRLGFREPKSGASRPPAARTPTAGMPRGRW